MRVFDRRQLLAVDGAGVDTVVREVFESSVAMGLTALRYLDVDPSEMDDVEATLRHLDETRLRAQLDEGDLSAGMDHRFKPGGGREADSVLEKFRRKRLAAKIAREENEAMGLTSES